MSEMENKYVYVSTYMFVFEWKLKRVDEICVPVLDDDEFEV